MVVTRRPNGSYKLRRESFSEIFYIRVSDYLHRDFSDAVPFYYVKTVHDTLRFSHEYWLFFLFFVPYARDFVKMFWFLLAKKVYDLGGLDIPDGEVLGWKWIKNIKYNELWEKKKRK